jgi:hypothetical protein
VKKLWWTWDLRMRWAPGFSASAESFIQNYTRAIDAAGRYGIEGIVVWGFLRDRHGGSEAAREIAGYGRRRNVSILPGVGIDAFGGPYCDGDFRFSLDRHLLVHPELQARRDDGSLAVHRWPATDIVDHRLACPSQAVLLDFYREALDWLFNTFPLGGVQIEQGDTGLCGCAACRARPRTLTSKCKSMALENLTARLPVLARHVLDRYPEALVIVENYSGLGHEDAQVVAPFLAPFPPAVYHSWQAYDGVGKFFLSEGSRSPAPHGCLAVRANGDFTEGETPDQDNIRRAVALARRAGLDMTYIYGEYPDDRPVTRANYDVWAEAAG